MVVQQQVHAVEDAAEDEDNVNEVSAELTPPSPTHDTDEEKPAEVEEIIKVVTAAKLMTKVVTTAANTITATQVLKASAPRQRRGDEAFARQLEAKLNANINWDDVMKQVKTREKQDNTVMRYQALKRKPVTEAQERKNMMIYLKNMAGFKMDFFKCMTYNDIRPVFKKHYNSIKDFLEKGEKEIEEEGNKRKALELMVFKTSRKHSKGLLLLVEDLMLL
nr:hypothetical protein [Tanacetum cinerariifolium]